MGLPLKQGISLLDEVVEKIGELSPKFSNKVSSSTVSKPAQKELDVAADVEYSLRKYDIPESKDVDLTKYEGHPVIINQSDRTRADSAITGAKGVQLKDPVYQLGGKGHMKISPSLWASMDTAAAKIYDKARRLEDKYKKQTILAPYDLKEKGLDFSYSPGELMLKFNNTKFDKGLRNSMNKEIKEIIPGWNPENIDTFYGASQGQKTAVVDLLENKYSPKGGLSQLEARGITTTPSKRNKSWFDIDELGLIDTSKPLMSSGRHTYSTGIPGTHIGKLPENVGAFELLPGFTNKDTGVPYIFKDVRKGVSADKRNPGRALQQGDPDLVITEELLRSLGYAGGGAALPIKLTKELIEAWKKKNILPKKDWLSQQPMKKELTQGLKDLKAGKINADDWAKLVKQYDAPRPYDAVPELTSLEDLQGALMPNKLEKGVIGLDATIPEGMKVGTRLDIPAYDQYQKWVNSVHGKFGKEGKTGVKYGQASHLVKGKDGKIKLNPHSKEAFGIAAHGKAKAPFAQIKGNWKNTKPEDIKKMADEALKDKSWTQIGFNPKRAGYYFDRNTFEPIVDADEILQIGPLVLGKNVGKAKPTDEVFKIKGTDINFKEGGEASDAEKFKLADDSYTTPIKRGLAMIGTGFGDLAHMAVSNLPLSQYGTVNIPEEDFFGTTKYAEKNWELPERDYDLLSGQGGLELGASLLGPAGIIKAVGVKGLGPLSKILKEKK